MESLKTHLKNKPQITEVYFNENGEWLFHKRPSFPIVKTREEILGESKKEEKPAEPKGKKSKEQKEEKPETEIAE